MAVSFYYPPRIVYHLFIMRKWYDAVVMGRLVWYFLTNFLLWQLAILGSVSILWVGMIGSRLVRLWTSPDLPDKTESHLKTFVQD